MLLLNTVISSQTPPEDITLKKKTCLQALFDSVFCPVYKRGSINFGLKSRYVFPALEVTSQNVFTEREKGFNGFLGAELNV